MGKVTGFLEYEREVPTRRPIEERVNDYFEIYQDFDDANEPLVQLKSYTLLNLAATYNVRANWQVFGRLNNILDKHYEEVFGYGTLPINFFGGTNFSW